MGSLGFWSISILQNEAETLRRGPLDPCIVVVRTRGDGVEGGAASIFSRLGFVPVQFECSKYLDRESDLEPREICYPV